MYSLNPIAAHEAGHAVIGEALGLIPFRATIVPSAEYVGAVFVVPNHGEPGAWIKMLLAGPISESRVSGQPPGDAIDNEQIATIIAKHGGDVRALAVETEALVTKLWPVIETVAYELDRRGTLFSNQLYAVINAAKETKH